MATVYKIQNVDGLFSSARGVYVNSFTKTGRAFSQLNHLKSHLRQVTNLSKYKDCKIVEYELIEKSKQDIEIGKFK